MKRKGLTFEEAGKLGWLKAQDTLLAQCQKKRLEARTKFLALDKVCLHCNVPITYEHRANKFCSHACRGFYYGALKRNPQAPITCQYVKCGKELPSLKKVGGRDRKYCTHECSVEQGKLNLVERIRSAGVANNPVSAKRYLAATYGYQCSIQECGTASWCGKQLTLTLDHIDGDGTNNKLDNLRLLCPNCHSQTPTYAGKNFGNGRVSRRERARKDYYRAKGRRVPRNSRSVL